MRSCNRGGELMRIDMLLVDVNSTTMIASINSPRIPKFRDRLAAGTMFSLSNFNVTPSTHSLKTTESPLMIRFTNTTEFDKIVEPSSPLPIESFRFCNETDLLKLPNPTKQLSDIVAEIIGVRSTVRDPPKGKNHVMVTIKLDSSNTVILSLFDCQAITLHRRLESMDVEPRVIVATNLKPSTVGSRLSLIATEGTHIYFDSETGPGQAYLNSLVVGDVGITLAAPNLKETVKIEPVTIADLNSFAITALSEDIQFMCTGRIIHMDSSKGWCYHGCSKCGRKLPRIENKFRCVRCNNPNAYAILRYRVELAIADATAKTVCVCFDGVMTKLHGIEAREAARMMDQDVNPEDSQMPQFLTCMEGQTYIFNVKLTTYDFTATHQSFTVTRMFNAHGRQQLPAFIDKGERDNDGHTVSDTQSNHTDVDAKGTNAEAVSIPVTKKTGDEPIDMDYTISDVYKQGPAALAPYNL